MNIHSAVTAVLSDKECERAAGAIKAAFVGGIFEA
jgi:hypothetical protein